MSARDTNTPSGSAGAERGKSKRVGALAGLWPFMRPYRRLMLAALAALVLTAAISLILPIAVRRVVDGFQSSAIVLLDGYFGAALGIALLLALGTGARYYLVTRLGERVVTDIRKAVFARVIRLSPAFYEKIMTGEVLSRITTDTTLILSVIGSSVSVALRNCLIFLGGMALMLFTSAKLTGLVLLIVPVVIIPIVVLGRRLRGLSRQNQDWIAASSGSASEVLLSVQTVQAFTHEGLSQGDFDRVSEKSYGAAQTRIGTRAIMTVIVIALIFSGVVGVLWVGARDVRAGNMSIGELVQFVIYAVLVAGAVGALQRDLGRVAARRRRHRAAGGTAERRGQRAGSAAAEAAAAAGEGRDRVRPGVVPLSDPAGAEVAGSGQLPRRSGRDGGAGRSLGRRQVDGDPADPAVLRSAAGAGDAGRAGAPRDGAGRFPSGDGAGAAGSGDLRRHRAREHPLRPPRCQRRRDRGGGQGRGGA